MKRRKVNLLTLKVLKKIIKKDELSRQVNKKTKQIKKLKKKRVLDQRMKYNIPGETNIWSFISELWIVKNSSILKWDFKKPDYGIEESFKNFLERHGYYEKKIKILLLNTPNITHMALPSNKNEYIFLLSVPFIRTLDLSKLEISILLFEDFLRAEKGFFKDFVSTKKVKSHLGSNFHGKKFDFSIYKGLYKKYDDMVFAKGFNFQQQFEVTKLLSSILKSNLKLWNTYFTLLKKIDDLIKSNILYSNYVKIYPSPELQINWLRPKKKVL